MLQHQTEHAGKTTCHHHINGHVQIVQTDLAKDSDPLVKLGLNLEPLIGRYPRRQVQACIPVLVSACSFDRVDLMPARCLCSRLTICRRAF